MRSALLIARREAMRQVAQIAHVAGVRHARDLERPQLDVVRGAILAGRVLAAPEVGLAARCRAARRSRSVSTPCLWLGSNCTTAIDGVGASKCGTPRSTSAPA